MSCEAVATFGLTACRVLGASTHPTSPIGPRLRNCRHFWPHIPCTLWGFHASTCLNSLRALKLSSLLVSLPVESAGLPRSHLLQSGHGCEAVVKSGNTAHGLCRASMQPPSPIGPRLRSSRTLFGHAACGLRMTHRVKGGTKLLDPN